MTAASTSRASVSLGLPPRLGSEEQPAMVGAAAFAALPSSVSTAVVASAGGSCLDAKTLSTLVSRVAPGGALELTEVVWATPDGPPTLTSPLVASLAVTRSLRTADALRKFVLFEGLAPQGSPELLQLTRAECTAAVSTMYPTLTASRFAPTPSAEANDATAALVAVLSPHLALCRLRALRPSYSAGAAFSLKSRGAAPSVPPPITPPQPPVPPAALVWGSLSTNPAPDVGLVDENDLLTEEDLIAKEAVKSECAPDEKGRRKACKNCSCGLKEMQEAGDESAALEAPKSNCGSCKLGDAFRCDGCPYRGTPAFKSGEEKLVLAELEQANLRLKEQKPVVQPTQGKVALSLADMDDDLMQM